jgi:hypothetical protein
MNSRLGHIRPILREVGKIWSATDMVRLYISVIQMTATFKLVLIYKEHCIKNKVMVRVPWNIFDGNSQESSRKVGK